MPSKAATAMAHGLKSAALTSTAPGSRLRSSRRPATWAACRSPRTSPAATTSHARSSPTSAPVALGASGSWHFGIGQDVEAQGSRFKVSEIHKRKAVYFYDNSYIAQGHFLILIVDAVNLQPGTSSFFPDIDFWLSDNPGHSINGVRRRRATLTGSSAD